MRNLEDMFGMIYIYITVFFKAQTPTELFQGATIKKNSQSHSRVVNIEMQQDAPGQLNGRENVFILCGVKTANNLCCLIQAPNQKAVCLDFQSKSLALPPWQSYKASLAVSREHDVLLMIVSGLNICR